MTEAITGEARAPGRHLALLWVGQLLSAVGDQLHQVALMWVGVEAVGARAGLIAGAGTAARLAFGLLGGVYADRWDRRRTMIATDVLRALLAATLALAALRGPLALWHLAAVAAALGALDSLFNPALQASLPALAPEPRRLQRLNAALNVNHRVALVVGPTLTGVLLAYMPIEELFGVDAVSFAVSALMIVAIGRSYAWRPRATGRTPGLRGVALEIADALRLVRAHPSLSWAIAALALSNVTWGALVVGVPLFARDVLRGGPETYGYLMGAYGVGNVISNVVLASVTVRRRAFVLFGGGVVFAVGCAALVRAPTLGTAMPLAALAALGGPMTDLMLLLIVQTDFPPDRIGKVWSFRGMVAQIGMGVGLAMAAPTFAGLGVAGATALMAAPAAVFSLVAAVRFRAE